MCGICHWLSHIHRLPKDQAISFIHCIHGDNYEQCGCGKHLKKCKHNFWINNCNACYNEYKDIQKGIGYEKRKIPIREFYIDKKL